MNRHLLLAGCAALALSAPSCISFTREPPQSTRYVLDVKRPEAATVEAAGPAIEVRQLHATPAYSGRKLVYRTGEDTIDVDFYSEFWVPPAAAITAALREWLGASQAFTTVRAGSLVTPDWIVEGDVVELYGDERGDPAAVLAVHLLVVEPTSMRVVCDATFRHREPVASNAARDVVAGLKACLRRVLADVERALDEARV